MVKISIASVILNLLVPERTIPHNEVIDYDWIGAAFALQVNNLNQKKIPKE